MSLEWFDKAFTPRKYLTPLTRDEERALAARIASGDRDAVEKLVLHNTRLARRLGERRAKQMGGDPEEGVLIALRYLAEAAGIYNGECSFTLFAQLSINNKMKQDGRLLSPRAVTPPTRMPSEMAAITDAIRGDGRPGPARFIDEIIADIDFDRIAQSSRRFIGDETLVLGAIANLTRDANCDAPGGPGDERSSEDRMASWDVYSEPNQEEDLWRSEVMRIAEARLADMWADETINDRVPEIVQRTLGIGCDVEHCSDIAAEMEISPQRANQLKQRGLKMLRMAFNDCERMGV